MVTTGLRGGGTYYRQMQKLRADWVHLPNVDDGTVV